MKDILKFIGLTIVAIIIGLLFVLFVVKISEYLQNQQDKKECYEIYATDDVILKKCKKYFEVDSNE